MKEKHLKIIRMVLDHQLLDANYVECGKVDDLELDGGPGEMRITAILTGPGVATDRLPRLLRPLKRLLGRGVTRVPWREVQVITSHLKLRSRAEHLGLNAADRQAGHFLARLPGAK